MFCQSGYVGVHISAGHKKGHIWGPRKSGGAQIKGDGRRNKSKRTGVMSGWKKIHGVMSGKQITGSRQAKTFSRGHVRQKLFHGVMSGKKNARGHVGQKLFSMQLNDFASNRPKVEKWSGKKICQILSGGQIN